MTQIIKPLSEDCINKIAAGEVVEKPFSVVKELLENSIDAGSTQIHITIDNGGKSLLKIVDNGCGISEADLDQCFLRYTTSKIENAEDLFALHTNGFRGEALSSIASVSKMKISSRTPDQETGFIIKLENGVLIEKSECAMDPGTIIEVRDLFFNTPVRKKFLGSDLSESNKITANVTRIALAHPDIQFKLSNPKKILFESTIGNIENRISEVMGIEFAKSMIPMEYDGEHLKISGFVCEESLSQKRRNNQFIFINQRPVWNITLSKAVENAYQSFFPQRHPMIVLFLNMSPADFDINVHPNKRDVRFVSEKVVFSSIFNTVKETLEGQLALSSPVQLNPVTPKEILPTTEFLTENSNDDAAKALRESEPASSAIEKEKPKTSFSDFASDFELETFEEKKETQDEDIVQDLFSQPETKIVELSKKEQEVVEFPQSHFAQQHIPPKEHSVSYFQMNRSYIVAESQAEMILIDQYRAHQRIIFEEARSRLSHNASFNSQQLLFPELIECSPENFMLIEESLVTFQSLGYDLETFGKNCFQIRGIPDIIKPGDVKDLFQDMIQDLNESSFNGVGFLEKVSLSYARAIAIRRDTELDQETMAFIVDSLFNTQNPYVTPDGKPIVIKMPFEDIHRKFGRY